MKTKQTKAPSKEANSMHCSEEDSKVIAILAGRILKLIPKHPRILRIRWSGHLEKIAGYKDDDLRSCMFRNVAALSCAIVDFKQDRKKFRSAWASSFDATLAWLDAGMRAEKVDEPDDLSPRLLRTLSKLEEDIPSHL